jgi:hypothetical protein
MTIIDCCIKAINFIKCVSATKYIKVFDLFIILKDMASLIQQSEIVKSIDIK